MLLLSSIEKKTKKEAWTSFFGIFTLSVIGFAFAFLTQQLLRMTGNDDQAITFIRMTVYLIIISSIMYIFTTISVLMGISLQYNIWNIIKKTYTELINNYLLSLILALILNYVYLRGLRTTNGVITGIDYLAMMFISIFLVSIIAARRTYKAYYLNIVLSEEEKIESQKSPLINWRADQDASFKNNLKSISQASVRQLFPRSTHWDNSTPKWFSFIIFLNLLLFPAILWVFTLISVDTVSWMIAICIFIQILWWGVWSLCVRLWNHKRRLLKKTRSLAPSNEEQSNERIISNNTY